MNYKELGKLLLDYNKGIKGKTYYECLVAELLKHYVNHTVIPTGVDIGERDLHYMNKEMFEKMVSHIQASLLVESIGPLKEQVQKLMNDGFSKEDIVSILF